MYWFATPECCLSFKSMKKFLSLIPLACLGIAYAASNARAAVITQATATFDCYYVGFDTVGSLEIRTDYPLGHIARAEAIVNFKFFDDPPVNISIGDESSTVFFRRNYVSLDIPLEGDEPLDRAQEAELVYSRISGIGRDDLGFPTVYQDIPLTPFGYVGGVVEKCHELGQLPKAKNKCS